MKYEKRRPEYDLVRVAAMIFVVLYHFFAELQNKNAYVSPSLIMIKPNITAGAVGVSLFLILSGRLCCMSYKKCMEGSSSKRQGILMYAGKRALAIFPTYWIAWLAAAVITGKCALFAVRPESLLKDNFILTIIGFDGYVGYDGTIRTCYLIGEWFLALIIVMYILLPVLEWFIKKYPKASAVFFIAYVACLVFFYKSSRPSTGDILYNGIFFVIGIYYAEYENLFNKRIRMILALVLLVLMFLNLEFLDFFGIIIFVVAVYEWILIIGNWLFSIDKKPVQVLKGMTGTCSKYCYAVFLVHHVTITAVFEGINGGRFTGLNLLWLLIYTMAFIIAMTVIVYAANEYVMKHLIKKNQKPSARL